MRDIDWEEILCGALVLFVLALVVWLVALVVAYAFTPIGCNSMTAGIGLPNQWTFFGGCKVFDGGHWMPLENWRYVGESLK